MEQSLVTLEPYSPNSRINYLHSYCTHQYNTFMVWAAPLVSAGWLSFFSPLTPEPITNITVARAIKDSGPFWPAIMPLLATQVRTSSVLHTCDVFLERSNCTKHKIGKGSIIKLNMATEVGDYGRQRSSSPAYKGYRRSRSKSRSPERRSRGDGLLPTPGTRYNDFGDSRKRSRSRSRERYNG